jgi:hypothetical protein
MISTRMSETGPGFSYFSAANNNTSTSTFFFFESLSIVCWGYAYDRHYIRVCFNDQYLHTVYYTCGVNNGPDLGEDGGAS